MAEFIDMKMEQRIMKKSVLAVALSAGIWLLAIAPSHGATITYDSIVTDYVNYTAPVLITGLEFEGEFWDVAIDWNTSYSNTYTVAPMFLGDSQGALDATNAIRQALLNDTPPFAGTGISASHLITPYSTSRGYGIWGDDMHVGLVSFGATAIYDRSGFSTWRASAVPVPAAAWLFSSGLIGLIGVARRKKR